MCNLSVLQDFSKHTAYDSVCVCASLTITILPYLHNRQTPFKASLAAHMRRET